MCLISSDWYSVTFQERVAQKVTSTDSSKSTGQSWSATDVSTLPTLQSIIFNKSLDLTEKLAQADVIIRNVRLFIGFASEAEFQNTVNLLALQDIEVLKTIKYERPDYFHCLLLLRPRSVDAKNTIKALPLAIGEEMVENDSTKLVDKSETIGETLKVIKSMDFDAQVRMSESKYRGVRIIRKAFWVPIFRIIPTPCSLSYPEL